MKAVLLALTIWTINAWAGTNPVTVPHGHTTDAMVTVIDRNAFSQLQTLKDSRTTPLSIQERGLALDMFFAYNYRSELARSGESHSEASASGGNSIFWLMTDAMANPAPFIGSIAHIINSDSKSVSHVELDENTNLETLDPALWLKGKSIVIIDGLHKVQNMTPGQLNRFTMKLRVALLNAEPWFVDAFVIDNANYVHSLSGVTQQHVPYIINGTTYIDRVCEMTLTHRLQ